MTPKEALDTAIHILGGSTGLARAVTAITPERPCSPQSVSQWTRCPVTRVLAVEEAVRRARRTKAPDRYDLRPDIHPPGKRKT